MVAGLLHQIGFMAVGLLHQIGFMAVGLLHQIGYGRLCRLITLLLAYYIR